MNQCIKKRPLQKRIKSNQFKSVLFLSESMRKKSFQSASESIRIACWQRRIPSRPRTCGLATRTFGSETIENLSVVLPIFDQPSQNNRRMWFGRRLDDLLSSRQSLGVVICSCVRYRRRTSVIRHDSSSSRFLPAELPD